jgi:lysophospholipase L1-like esterase
VFLLIGTNDISYGKTVQHVVDNHKKIIARIREASPQTQIYVQSVLPVQESIHPTRPIASIQEINRQLQELSKSGSFTYIDLYALFADDAGALDMDYSIDGLHLNAEGYLKWVKAVEKFVLD